MKKLITLATLVVAITSQAASINWGTGSKTAYNGTTIGGVSATLIYLGTSDLAASYSFTESDSLSDIIDKIGTKADETSSTASGMQKGKLFGTWNIGESGTPNLSDGDNLVILSTYTDGGKTYYNLSNVKAASYNSAAGLWNNATDISASWGNASEAGTLVAGGGWTLGAASQDPITPEVPEPATGALALAGVALLFKRRRA